MKQNIIKSSTLKRKEYKNHLERCFFFLNILFRIENTITNGSVKESLNSSLSNIKSNIKNILQEFEYEKTINQHKNLMLEFLNNQQKNYKKLFENSNIMLIFNQLVFLIPIISIDLVLYAFKGIVNLFKKNEKKFNDYLKDLKEEINNETKYCLFTCNDKMKKYENLINYDISKFLGLIEASSIQADDSYNEAKENYLEIYEDYKKWT